MVMRQFLLLFLLLLICGCGGGGSGGGGGSTLVTLSGRVLWIETGSGTNPVSTVQAGTASTTTDPLDGFFQFDVSPGTASVTVTYVPGTGGPIVRTFSFGAVTDTTDVGDLYIGPESVTLHGTVVDASTNLPVAGATVTIAGRSATTLGNGTFSVANVAYSSSNPAVFLGLEGTVTAQDYFARNFSPPTLATGGVVEVGTVALTPTGSNNPPPPPYDVVGTVLPTDQGALATITVKKGNAIIRQTTADSLAKFSLWLPVGTFTVEATNGTNSGSTTVTVTDTSVIKSINVNF